VASVLRVLAALALASVAVMVSAQLALHRAAWRAERARRICRDDADVVGGIPGLWAVARESLLTLLVLLAWPAGAALPPPERRRGVVVLVHGFAGSPASAWLLARRLRRDGWAVAVPRLGAAWRDVADASDRLEWYLDRVRDEHGVTDVVLLAHGVAGLAARLLVHRAGRRAGVRLLVTLGTPHGGTLACPWFRLGPWRNDVRPGSALLGELATGALPARTEAIAIASPGDALVVPAERGYWSEACNVSVEGSGHLHLLVSARVHAVVAENLEAFDAPTARRHAD